MSKRAGAAPSGYPADSAARGTRAADADAPLNPARIISPRDRASGAGLVNGSSASDRPASDRPASDRPASDRPASARPASARPASPRPAPSAASPEPSWPQVIATTIRLWAERRLHRPGTAARPRHRGRALAVVLALVVVLAGVGLGLALVRGGGARHQASRPPATAPRQAGQQPRAQGAQGAGAAALAAAAANRQHAASWIAAQVGHNVMVSCDPVMCAVLQARGFPAGDLLTLNAAAPDPMGSQLVVATTALRSQFGRRLPDVFAPLVIASFGSGAARVDVRVEAVNGTQAYLIALRADLLARRSTGQALLRDHRVHVSGASRRALAAGRVDSRLLDTLNLLAAELHRVYVSRFGDVSPGAAAGVPLRMVRISALAPASRPRHARTRYLHAALRLLRAQRSPFRGAVTVLHPGGGKTVIQVEFAAPSPLGLLGASASP